MPGRELALVVAGATLLLVSPASAQRARVPSDAPVFAGVRPTTPDFGATEIRLLGEAQDIREIVENVLEVVFGEPVLGYQALQKQLGPAYLVDLFDCNGRTRCIARLLGPLARRGHRRAAVADYSTDGESYRFRAVLFSLPAGRVLRRTEFSLTREQLRDAKAWSRSFETLFSDRGKLMLVTNVRGFTCTVDARPCDLGGDGLTLSLPAGEHVIELRKRGFRSTSRIVEVETGREQRIGMALEPLPIQVAPSPSRLNEGLRPERELPVAADLFGRISLTLMADPLNSGDIYDEVAVPEDVQQPDWHVSILPNHTFLGASINSAKRDRQWQVKGLFVVGMFTLRLVRVIIGQVQLVREDLGLQVTVGRMFHPTINAAEPGTLSEQTSFGSLRYAMTGAKVSKTFGPVVIDVGVGRPESPLLGDTVPRAESAGPIPFAEGRVAYLVPGLSGQLYGQNVPLTLAVSGAVGQQRVGPGELEVVRAIDPEAAEPVTEDLLAYLGSAEAILPLGRVVLAAEAFAGEGTGIYGGGMFQRPRVDLETGRHRQIRAAGGWAQISVNVTSKWEALALAGMDRVISGFSAGVATNGAPPMESNRILGGVISFAATKNMKFSAELHQLQTEYRDLGTASMLVALFDSQLNF